MKKVLFNQSGQAMLESTVVMPLLVVMAFGLVLSIFLHLTWFRVLSFQNEIAVCTRSLQSRSICESQGRNQIQKLFRSWGFQNVQVHVVTNQNQVSTQIRSQILGFPLEWKVSTSISASF